MPVLRFCWSVALCCALLVVGCRDSGPECPRGTVTADPQEIPSGVNETSLFVEVSDPFPPSDDVELVTELVAESGTIDEPFALATTYACAHDKSGPIEICVTTTYINPDIGDRASSDVPNAGAASEYIRRSHVQIPDPLECSETTCTVVVCPAEKNSCPEVSSFMVTPMELAEGETATITVLADDPDENPEPLVTTLTARSGTIVNPNAAQATYSCDPEVGGVIQICVLASDGDSSCDVQECTTVRCPGDPLDNTCPIIESLTADPNPIVVDDKSTIRVDAMDPDDFPGPLVTELSSDRGGFEDRFASETTFRCGRPGPIEVCVEASDGDESCPEESRCITVECPGDIVTNICPNLNVINAIPSTIESPNFSTVVQTRGWDTDLQPIPLVLTLSALWGSFQNTENMPGSGSVVQQNAAYICDRPGEVEICVEATDGACNKTLCTDVFCPDDVPTSP